MNVKNVGGGYIAWVDNGLPVLAPEVQTTLPPIPADSATVN
jgi:hypothetical protein